MPKLSKAENALWADYQNAAHGLEQAQARIVQLEQQNAALAETLAAMLHVYCTVSIDGRCLGRHYDDARAALAQASPAADAPS